MVIETQQQYDDACAEVWELINIDKPTDEQLGRINELADAIVVFEKAKWGWDLQN